MKRPIESDYASHVSYTRALEEYCDSLEKPAQEQIKYEEWVYNPMTGKPIWDATPPLLAQEPVHCQCIACKDGIIHASDCAVHNGPAYPAGPCDCGAAQKTKREALKLALEVMQINLTLLEKINPYKGQEELLSDSLELTHEAIASIEVALEQPAQEPMAFNEFLESEDFYDLMQAYRHCQIDAYAQFEAVKDALRANV
jgi:hypothetical protein